VWCMFDGAGSACSRADCPKGPKKCANARKAKRKAEAPLPGAKRARRAGGICLSDDEDDPLSSTVEAEEEQADGEQVPEGAAHTASAVQEEAKPKPKSAVDDIFAEMKKDTSIKKASAPKTDISSFINGLVSKSAGAGGAAAKGGAGGKFDVASLFPTSVSKKKTVTVCLA
jgi:hypothetical protein